MRAGRLTCRALVQQYLRRIEAYDKHGPAINAIVVINPQALDEADDLDRRFKASGPVGPLHCVPAIVKDNFETIGLQSADGSLALEGIRLEPGRVPGAGGSRTPAPSCWPSRTWRSSRSRRTRRSARFCRATRRTPTRSIASRPDRAAARPRRSPRTSALIGLGSDTGNSIRGPSSHQALVGIRSTMGLTSRGGVVPLNLLADIAGPMARTVEDAVRGLPGRSPERIPPIR